MEQLLRELSKTSKSKLQVDFLESLRDKVRKGVELTPDQKKAANNIFLQLRPALVERLAFDSVKELTKLREDLASCHFQGILTTEFFPVSVRKQICITAINHYSLADKKLKLAQAYGEALTMTKTPL